MLVEQEAGRRLTVKDAEDNEKAKADNQAEVLCHAPKVSNARHPGNGDSGIRWCEVLTRTERHFGVLECCTIVVVEKIDDESRVCQY